jgi:hypothetical protein
MGEPLARARVGGRRYSSVVRLDERTVLERAIQRVTEQGANADAIVDEAIAAGLDGSDKIVVSTKMLRAEPLSVNAVRTRTGEGCHRLLRVRKRVHYVGGLGVRAGHGRTRSQHRTRPRSWDLYLDFPRTGGSSESTYSDSSPKADEAASGCTHTQTR